MYMRQTRRGWLQECLGCEARTEMKYYAADGNTQIAHSLDDASCPLRFCCPSCYPYTTQVKELNTEAELLTAVREFRCPSGGCKCCCYQEIMVSSGGTDLGGAKEKCYFCVPQFNIYDSSGQDIYIVHPPTCCGGVCVNCCTEGNPCCGRGCCKVPFWIFDISQKGNTGGSDAAMLGKILKVPKSIMTEIFTDANAFELHFPNDASAERKALVAGSALLVNSNFFENNGGD